MRQETCDRIHDTRDWRRKSGNRRQETGTLSKKVNKSLWARQETGIKRQEMLDRSHDTLDRRSETRYIREETGEVR